MSPRKETNTPNSEMAHQTDLRAMKWPLVKFPRVPVDLYLARKKGVSITEDQNLQAKNIVFLAQSGADLTVSSRHSCTMTVL